jgi:hypothetical protein
LSSKCLSFFALASAKNDKQENRKYLAAAGYEPRSSANRVSHVIDAIA